MQPGRPLEQASNSADCLPSLTRHSRSIPLLSYTSRVWLSGVKLSAVTAPAALVKVRSSSPLALSHRTSPPSNPAVASHAPSGLAASALTPPSCALTDQASTCVSISQTLSCPSWDRSPAAHRLSQR